MKKQRVGTAIATAAVASTMFTPLAHAQDAAPQPSAQCGAVHIITANGTGGSGENISKGLFPLNMQPLIDKVQQDHPGKVTFQEISYPSSAGAMYSISPLSDNPKTYGLSRLKGDMNGLDHVKEFSAQCPNTMLAFAGYSQGASVMGDLTALIANGAVPGVGPEKILGAFLFADPGRSGNSQYSGPSKDVNYWIPQPSTYTYQRNGEISTSKQEGTVGWTGQRSLPFTGVEGRVISLCNDADLACSAGTNTVLRDLADISDKDIWPNKAYRDGRSLSQILLTEPGVSALLLEFLPKLALYDDYNGLLATLQQKAYALPISDLDKGVVINAAQELEKILDFLHRDELYGEGVTDRAMLAHLLATSYPQVREMIPDFPNKEATMPAIDGTVAALSAFNTVPADVRARVEEPVTYLSAFPTEHAAYFSDKHSVDGVPAIQWASQALSDGITNYLNGTTLVMPADASNTGTVEIAEPDRKDDGLRSLLKYTEQGISVLGEDTNDFPTPSDGNMEWDEDLKDKDDSTYDPNESVVSSLSSASSVASESKSSSSSSKSASKKSTTRSSTSSSTAVSSPAVPVNGPKVNTGGSVKQPLAIDELMSIFM